MCLIINCVLFKLCLSTYIVWFVAIHYLNECNYCLNILCAKRYAKYMPSYVGLYSPVFLLTVFRKVPCIWCRASKQLKKKSCEFSANIVNCLELVSFQIWIMVAGIDVEVIILHSEWNSINSLILISSSSVGCDGRCAGMYTKAHEIPCNFPKWCAIVSKI